MCAQQCTCVHHLLPIQEFSSSLDANVDHSTWFLVLILHLSLRPEKLSDKPIGNLPSKDRYISPFSVTCIDFHQKKQACWLCFSVHTDFKVDSHRSNQIYNFVKYQVHRNSPLVTENLSFDFVMFVRSVCGKQNLIRGVLCNVFDYICICYCKSIIQSKSL